MGIVAVTLEEVAGRTRELALMAGRTPLQVSLADYEQAKRELLGGPDANMRRAHRRPQAASTPENIVSTTSDTR